jgi:Raf kinase inhibitor-like YbhB/YbcL family protein
MRTTNNNQRVRIGVTLAILGAAAVLTLARADDQGGGDWGRHMEVTSATFTEGTTLPDSAIDNIPVNGVNACTPDGSAGGDMSPQLTWKHAPHNTRSFVVVLYDTTAAFTHWGMYNISGHTTSLPQGAGVADSSFGHQVNNDFGDPNYDGPCPPPGVAPDAHDYVFTVYALDTELVVPSSANFPANAETLYHALIQAARDGHVLASASITGLFSSTPTD